jgi:hypothetical protein
VCRERIDGRPNVVIDMLERARLARAVTHATVIESKHRIAGRRQAARHQHELAMAANTVLRPTHDNHNPKIPSRRRGLMHDADEGITRALEC